MIRLFFASIVFAVFISPASALQVATDPTVKTRTVKLNKKFKNIILNGDAEVLFVKDNTNEISIEERASIENIVKIKNENGTVIIESKDFYRQKPPLIMIPVSYLESLELNGDVSVATTNTLLSKQLNVLINGDCKVQIVTTGKVFFESSPDYHLKYTKKTTRFLPAP